MSSLPVQRLMVRRGLPAILAMSRRHHPFSVLAVLTASAATTLQQPMSTLAEAATTGKKSDKVPLGTTATTNTTTQRHIHIHHTADHAHHYGSPLLAQDIYFNDVVREGLGTIRRQHATQAAAAAATEDHDEYESSYSHAAEEEQPHDDVKAMSVLERSGHRNAATLTLIGYKG